MHHRCVRPEAPIKYFEILAESSRIWRCELVWVKYRLGARRKVEATSDAG